MCRYHVWHRFQMFICYFVSERRFYQRVVSLITTYDRCLFLNIKKLQKIVVLIKAIKRRQTYVIIIKTMQKSQEKKAEIDEFIS